MAALGRVQGRAGWKPVCTGPALALRLPSLVGEESVGVKMTRDEQFHSKYTLSSVLLRNADLRVFFAFMNK